MEGLEDMEEDTVDIMAATISVANIKNIEVQKNEKTKNEVVTNLAYFNNDYRTSSFAIFNWCLDCRRKRKISWTFTDTFIL